MVDALPSVFERRHSNPPRPPMKEPDEQQDGFDPEIFDEALRKIPLEDLVRLQRDAIQEIRAAALMDTVRPCAFHRRCANASTPTKKSTL